MALRVAVSPLPDCASFLTGYYGIEECYIRGLISVHCNSSVWPRIVLLSIHLNASTECSFLNRHDPLENLSRKRKLYDLTEIILSDIVPQNISSLQIPFELLLPETIPDPSATPAQLSARLNPPSYNFSQYQSLSSTTPIYTAKTSYSLIANLEIDPPPLIFGLFKQPSSISAETVIKPWLVFDPKLIPRLLFPDSKKWRSAPDSEPIEFDIDFSSIVMGPSDKVKFNYRLAVSQKAARHGVRLHTVKLNIREFHYVGDTRGNYIRGVQEIFKWSQFEGPAASVEVGVLELGQVKPTGKEGILRSGCHNGGSGGDGLYAENEVVVTIPSIGNFTPTVSKITDSLRNNIVPAPSQVEVKHSIQVIVELKRPSGVESYEFPDTKLECGCILASVGKAELSRVMDEDGIVDIFPKLDYEKVTGGEAYIPVYEEEDPLIREARESEEYERRKLEERKLKIRERFWRTLWIKKRMEKMGDQTTESQNDADLAEEDEELSFEDLSSESDIESEDLEIAFGPFIPKPQVFPSSPPPTYIDPPKPEPVVASSPLTQEIPPSPLISTRETLELSPKPTSSVASSIQLPHPLETLEPITEPFPTLPPFFPFSYIANTTTDPLTSMSETSSTSSPRNKGKQRIEPTTQTTEPITSTPQFFLERMINPVIRKSNANAVFDDAVRSEIEVEIKTALQDYLVGGKKKSELVDMAKFRDPVELEERSLEDERGDGGEDFGSSPVDEVYFTPNSELPNARSTSTEAISTATESTPPSESLLQEAGNADEGNVGETMEDGGGDESVVAEVEAVNLFDPLGAGSEPIPVLAKKRS
ncbi:hypothetical protein HK098_002439 [Nowakowskiella sp. JEL0407]|nr:hypothetical protein HK098_002439 [Nowakowskiella sp. JEL0407]